MTTTARRGILLIETSGTPAFTGLALPDGRLLVRTLASDRRHARDLLGTIRDLLIEAELTISNLAKIGLSLGPGGYTGLRVGLAAAKTLAFSTGADLHAIPTFEWLVQCAPPSDRRAICTFDALKDQVYTQSFEWLEESGWNAVSELGIRPLRDLVGQDAVYLVEAKVAAKLPVECRRRIVAEIPAVERLRSMASFANAGLFKAENLAIVEPLYLRGSSAEELAKSK